MKADPLVSVVIDNYNYAHLLGATIESVLAQTYSRVETIVVDDGSTDESRTLIEGFGERVRPIYKTNGGQASAFNAGVAAVRGEIVCFLDADDLWTAEKVQRVVEVFAAEPRADWIRHRLQVIDASASPVGVALPWISRSRLQAPDPLLFIEGRVPVLTSAVALRRELAERVFPLPERTPPWAGEPGLSLRWDADAYLAFRAAACGGWAYSLNEVLGSYRRHGSQRFEGLAGIETMMTNQIDIARAATSAFEGRVPDTTLPSSVYKHRALLAGLRGHAPWTAERGGPLLRGMRAILPLAPRRPGLFARQAAALGFAWALPRLWTWKLLRHQGFVPFRR